MAPYRPSRSRPHESSCTNDPTQHARSPATVRPPGCDAVAVDPVLHARGDGRREAGRGGASGDGADGDDWSLNNVHTGGAGAIGFVLKDKETAKRVRELAA